MKAKVKVCGMKEPENIQGLTKLNPDLIGFIFYRESKRFVGENFDPATIKNIPETIKSVGVFVNTGFEELISLQRLYKFDWFQLHGDESPELCKRLKEQGVTVIKAFSVDSTFDFNVLKPYEDSVNYFLFDTKGENYGGSGVRFDWNILKKYKRNVPFFLSGGIGLEQLTELVQFEHEQLYAIDVNSKFELSPGIKDLDKIDIFFSDLKNQIANPNNL